MAGTPQPKPRAPWETPGARDDASRGGATGRQIMWVRKVHRDGHLESLGWKQPEVGDMVVYRYNIENGFVTALARVTEGGFEDIAYIKVECTDNVLATLYMYTQDAEEALLRYIGLGNEIDKRGEEGEAL